MICPAEMPLLGFFSLVLPLLSAGNTVVAVPSESLPADYGRYLSGVRDERPAGGALNIVPGRATELLKVLAEHDDLDAVWCYGNAEMCAMAKALSTGNLKQVWTNEGREIDFLNARHGEGRWFLEHADQVKNVWVPYGE